MPTTIVGLSRDSTADSEISKLFAGSIERAFACHRTVILPETAFILAFQAGADHLRVVPPRPLAAFSRLAI